MADDDFDFALLGETVVKPSTHETADPVQILTNKGTVLYFGAHWSERKLNIPLTHSAAFCVLRSPLHL
jgi:hypothetical protein